MCRARPLPWGVVSLAMLKLMCVEWLYLFSVIGLEMARHSDATCQLLLKGLGFDSNCCLPQTSSRATPGSKPKIASTTR